MVRARSFRRNVFKTVLLVTLVPALGALLAITLLLRGMGTGTGTLGPWDAVAESGRGLIEQARLSAPDDPAVEELARRHQEALTASVQQSRLYAFVTDRALRLLPWAALLAGLALAGLSAWAARAVARRLHAPIGELVDWTQRIGRGEPLPPTEGVERPMEEFRVLGDALRSMERSLADARDQELEAARIRAWSDLARRVAHELKNPLTPIRMGATALARNREAAVAETGEMILAEVQRLDDMARDFSRFGKPPSGPPAPVDLGELIRILVGRHAPPQGTPPRIEVEVSPGTPLIQGHHDALSRALLNLLVNALEALDDQPDGVVRIVARAVPGGAEVTLEDNGPGIPEELREAVWSPEVTTRRRGSGLGLALVRQTVQAHGGTIELEPAPGRGTRFRITLPASGA